MATTFQRGSRGGGPGRGGPGGGWGGPGGPRGGADIGAKADPVAAEAIAALINDAPVPAPTTLKTFGAMMAREFRVLGRNAVSTFMRSVMQPLLFVFVFSYVFPKIGSGFSMGGAGSAAAAGATAGG